MSIEAPLSVLVLDGGGGKAPVFFGALRALEEFRLLDSPDEQPCGHIERFVASSTGTIIATLLACDAPPRELESAVAELLAKLARADVSSDRTRPAIRTDDNQELSFTCAPVADAGGLPPLLEAGLRRYMSVAGVLRSFLPLERTSSRFRHWMLDRMGVDATLVNSVLENVPGAVSSFYVDGGILDGCDFRQAIDGVLSATIAGRTGQHVSNLTFRQHHAVFERDLCLVATNLSNGKSLPFTRLATPDLPIADAIRLSIALPLIVKPVYLAPEAAAAAGASSDYAGLWIDGGVINSAWPSQLDKKGSGYPGRWLALRLAADGSRVFSQPVDEVPILRFLPRALLETIWSSAASQSASPDPEPVITLTCDGLSAHRFLPDPEALERAQHRAYEDVKQHLKDQGYRTGVAQ